MEDKVSFERIARPFVFDSIDDVRDETVRIMIDHLKEYPALRPVPQFIFDRSLF
ncbi:MAG: hypothetical protein KAR06_01630 [Deltaproteobacteria bacterium]|nr:hypothetical protein [Deltaproteobacteria bacterium]